MAADPTTADAPEDPPGSFASMVADLAEMAPLIDDGLDASTLGERQAAAVALLEALDRVEAAASLVAGTGADRFDNAMDGAPSMALWLTARTEADRSRANSLLHLHDRLRHFDDLRRAWADGRIGTAKVRAVLKAATGLDAQLARDQAELVERIATRTVAQARRLLAAWRIQVLAELDESPDDPRPDDQPVNSTRYGPGVGTETVATTILDPIHATEFQRLIDAEIDRCFRVGTYTADDGMSLDERRLDAQLSLMRRGSVVSSEGGEPRKSVILLVDLRHLMPDLDVTALERALWPCETSTGTPVDRDDVLATLLGNTAVSAVLGFYGVSGRFRPVGEITTARLPDAARRRLLATRDGGCMFPGCEAPASRCQPHHEPPYEVTGRTTTDELVLLCRHHHRRRHVDGFTIDLAPDGEMTVRRPDGTALPQAPPGTKVRRAA